MYNICNITKAIRGNFIAIQAYIWKQNFHINIHHKESDKDEQMKLKPVKETKE